MSEKGLFIKADVSYSDRWLYPSDVFRKEKNLNIALPNEREFMTGECIVTDKDDTAYSIDELVNLLNYFNRCTVSNKEFMELKEENEELKQFQDRVFSWIDMHLQRLPTLIDDEFNSDNEFADPSLYSGALQILETMKKELKGDME